MENEKLLNQIEVSRRWGMSCRTLERWRWLGMGPRFIKIGGRVKYRLCDLKDYEEMHLCQSTADPHYWGKKPV
jgi:hypothetical protein